MSDRNHFGEALRSLRMEKGMTKATLAANASVSACEIADLENGIRMPRAATIKKLADALGVASEALVSELQKDIEEND